MLRIIIFYLCGFLNFCFAQDERLEYKKIDSLFSFIGENEPGITIGVVKNGELIYSYQRGMANLEYDIPFNKHTVFGVASITKQITSACIGVLEHKGMLNVNDDVRKYIPEFPDYKCAIKIKHLLNHTSGLRNHNVLLNLQGFDYDHMGYTNKSIEKLIFSQKGVNNIPGEKILYANSNYVLLALIVERVSGNKIDVFAKEKLFNPLGMEHTFYKNSLEQIIKNRAYSYYKEGKEFKQPKSLTHCIGAGGVGSTIVDMAKWSNLFMDLSSNFSYLSEFITTLEVLNDGDQMKYARGVFVSPYKGYKTINHSGRDLGMRSQLICLPNEKLAVVLFSNSEEINAVHLSYKVLDLFLESKEDITEDKEYYTHSSTELQKLTGDYQEINSDLGMKILIEGNVLKAKSSFGRTPIPLKEIGENKFHRVQNLSVGYQFFNEGNKNCDLEVDFGGAKFYFEKVKLQNPELVNLNDFIGEYYSEELNVTYQLFVENETLFCQYPNNPKTKLVLGQKDEFGSQDRTRYYFNRDEEKIIGFSIASEGTVKDILFQKTIL